MRTIDPNTIYSAKEVREIIHGVVKLETLREKGGLVSLPGAGYWGADLISAINTMQEQRRRCRGSASLPPMEPVQKSIRREPLRKPKAASRPVENQRSKFKRLMENQKKEKAKS